MTYLKEAQSSDAFEVVSMSFKKGTSLDEQKSLMEKLNSIVTQFEGFKSRDYFYSKDNGRWIDFVVWVDVGSAKKASEQVMKNPEAGAVFSQIEESSMMFSHYSHAGGVGQ